MKTEGKCKFCGRIISGTAMTRHLKSCAERNKIQESEPKEKEIFLLRASAGPFWVYFEVDALSSLKKVDAFLRRLWLECCGHLSAFTINDVHYCSHPTDFDDRGMEVPLKRLLAPGQQFLHEYDFGTTTQLLLKCISKRKGSITNIEILARNNLPDFRCHKCDKPAKGICTECLWDDEDFFLCESCAKEHGCDEEMFLPVVNSPRMGICGYTGED